MNRLASPRSVHTLLGLALVASTLTLAQPARANLWGCLFANPGCTWVYYQTDLTCADITTSNIGIQQCVDAPIAQGGGVGLPGTLQGISPEYNGLVNLGGGPFPGSIQYNGITLDNFVVTRPFDPVDGVDPVFYILAFDWQGNVYQMRVGPDMLEKAGNYALQATPGGNPIISPLDGTSLIRQAGGDVSVSLHSFTVGPSTHFDDGSDSHQGSSAIPSLQLDSVGDVIWDISFASADWDMVASGAVADTPVAWSSIKAMYN